ncbi:hypothetical protein JB92DRAFT_235990 [Gautieria morchelliformis]|nr:hypothetical protein JB92DRAFT_235990 [Gautieria morchelliformis]
MPCGILPPLKAALSICPVATGRIHALFLWFMSQFGLVWPVPFPLIDPSLYIKLVFKSWPSLVLRLEPRAADALRRQPGSTTLVGKTNGSNGTTMCSLVGTKKNANQRERICTWS